MNLARTASIDDLRMIARRRMPRFAFDFVDGGADEGANVRRNRQAFDEKVLVPRYLRNVETRKTETELLGRTWNVPFGFAPVGLLNMVWPGADLAMARLAAKHGFPHVISTACTTPMEEIAQAAEGNAWFQLYVSPEDATTEDILKRAERSGCETLVVTVDVAVQGKRNRDLRNALTVPFRMTPAIIADCIMHPSWSLGTLSAGASDLVNFEPYAAEKGGRGSLAALQAARFSSAFDWEALKRLRERWKGPLAVKGILHPDDAVMCGKIGCEAVVVSNHGGRQASYAPASLEMLPAIRSAVGADMVLIIDSGIRNGPDIIKAKALGADFALLGRAFCYGLGAGGAAGAKRAFDLIESELAIALAQLGCPDFADVGPKLLAYRSASSAPS